MKQKVKKFIINKYLLGSLMVTFIYSFKLIIGKIYPFGENTILISDLNAQYIYLFCYLKDILLGAKGIFMSWNLGMANGFYINFMYYLSNPINVLVIFFNKTNMFVFVDIVIYIKLILIFNSFTLYIEKVYNYKKIDLVLFGIAYTFSSYVITYYFNIMWLDVMYVLPISVLCINKYIKTGKMYPIIFSYIYILFVQYYMAYSMIIFCSIYYVVMYWLQNKLSKENIKDFVKKTILLAIATVLSVGVAMVVFLPILSTLNNITNIQNQYINIENLNLNNVINIFTNHYEYQNTQTLGFAFCGSLNLVLLVSFFVNKNITIKEKIIYLGLLIFMFLPVISPKIYVLWHGGTATHGFSFRYSYLLMFVFVTIGFKSYKNIEKQTKTFYVLLYIFFGIFTLIEILQYISYNYYDKEHYLKVVFSVIIIYGNISLIWLNCKDNKKIVFICMLIIELIEIFIVFYYNNKVEVNIEEYNENEQIIPNAINTIKTPELERVIIDEDEYGNNSLRYNYSTIDFFASGRNLETLLNMNKIGYTTFYVSVAKDSKTLITDMISGVRYYIFKSDSEDLIKADHNYNNLLKFVKKIDENNYLYKNDYSLPFIYYIPSNLEISEDEDIFYTQNKILNNYRKETIEKFINNIEEKNDVLNYTKQKNEEIISNKYLYDVTKFNVKASKDTDIYIKCNNCKPIYSEVEKSKCNVIIGDLDCNVTNDKLDEIKKNYYPNFYIHHLVSLKKGEEFCIEIELNKEEIEEHTFEIYAFDDDKIKGKMESVNQDLYKINNIGKNGMDGKISLDEDGFVCFQISYDKGWHIEIDEKEIDAQAIYDVFLGAKLEKGEHNFKIYYIPQGFKEGGIVTVISIILLSILLVVNEKKK